MTVWADALAVSAAGAAASLGPCTASRGIALAGLIAGREARAQLRCFASYAAGIIAIYALFGSAGAMIAQAVRISPWAYLVSGGAMIAAGITTMLKHHCAPERGGDGMPFLAGIAAAAVVSPCCVPVLIGIAAMASADGPLRGALLGAAFAVGHIAPLAAIAAGAPVLRAAAGERFGAAVRATGAALLVGVGVLYVVVA